MPTQDDQDSLHRVEVDTGHFAVRRCIVEVDASGSSTLVELAAGTQVVHIVVATVVAWASSTVWHRSGVLQPGTWLGVCAFT